MPQGSILGLMETKRCSTCLKDLPATEFYRRANGQSRGATCRTCEKARTKAWRMTDRGAASSLATSRKYNASEKGKAKRKEYRNSEANREIQKRWAQTAAGKACAAKYRQTDKRKAALKRYYESGRGREAIDRYHKTDKGRACLARSVHKRRSNLANCVSTLTAAEWREIKARYKNRCAYCGRQMQRLTMDHVIPLSKGGHHVAGNIVPACRSCNSRKGNRLPAET